MEPVSGTDDGDLLRAAVLYLWLGTDREAPMAIRDGILCPLGWPRDPREWAPGTRLENLLRAGALCSADRERRMQAGLPTGPADHKLELVLEALRGYGLETCEVPSSVSMARA